MKVLVTGAAGFIGYHVARALLERGDSVAGFDSVNDYYGPALKEDRLGELVSAAQQYGASFTFLRANLADAAAIKACFASHRFDRVIHLAAQAGVRYAAENPQAYVESNIVGFTNLLEACRHAQAPHLTYASSSSVYGASTKLPYAEHEAAVHPLQFYAATKRANELMAHAYSHLFALPTTGLRFFTVYGPWGRPDMALFTFTRNILAGQPIELFNGGDHSRDFTYVDDAVAGVIAASDRIAAADPSWRADNPDAATSNAPFRLYNIGTSRPVRLAGYVAAIERKLGIKAQVVMQPAQDGDMRDTFADIGRLSADVGYLPRTNVEDGVAAFVDWYRAYYRV